MEIYTGRNEDGWICSYDKKTHKCVGAMLSTGDDIEFYKKNIKKWIGQIDPKYKDEKP